MSPFNHHMSEWDPSKDFVPLEDLAKAESMQTKGMGKSSGSSKNAALSTNQIVIRAFREFAAKFPKSLTEFKLFEATKETSIDRTGTQRKIGTYAENVFRKKDSVTG